MKYRNKISSAILLALLLTGLTASIVLAGIYLVPTHPHFWPLQTGNGYYNWTAKQFQYINTGQFVWVWSGPYGSNREIHYCDAPREDSNRCEYDNDSDWEWEEWRDNGDQSATNYQFGGRDPSASKDIFRNAQCTISGVTWPDLGDSDYNYVDYYALENGVCVKKYISVMRGEINDKSRFCSLFFDDYPVAHSICLNEQIQLVFQAYGTYNQGGVCEAITYVEGNPKPSPSDSNTSSRVKNWFRNGELSFSIYLSLTENVPNPNDAYTSDWWKSRCYPAFWDKPNLIYTGKYKLNNSVYQDSGN